MSGTIPFKICLPELGRGKEQNPMPHRVELVTVEGHLRIQGFYDVPFDSLGRKVNKRGQTILTLSVNPTAAKAANATSPVTIDWDGAETKATLHVTPMVYLNNIGSDKERTKIADGLRKAGVVESKIAELVEQVLASKSEE